MAQVSHSTSQDHMATAFHFLRVNMLPELLLFFAPLPPADPPLPDAEPDAPVSIGADSESILNFKLRTWLCNYHFRRFPHVGLQNRQRNFSVYSFFVFCAFGIFLKRKLWQQYLKPLIIDCDTGSTVSWDLIFELFDSEKQEAIWPRYVIRTIF